METDFILNGVAHGGIAQMLLNSGFNLNSLRPWIGRDGNHYITSNQGGKLEPRRVQNANATLTKDEWKQLDAAVRKAGKPRLTAVADLRARGLEYVIPNGMGKTVLETQAQSDISDAQITMDGLEDGQRDRPLYDLTSMPLPIIHKDFFFSARQLQSSRNGNSPLDTSMASLAGQKVAETAEKLLIGSTAYGTFGGGTLYGYTTFPYKISAEITSPAADGWSAATTVSDVLGMMQSSIEAYHYGPWVLYYGPSWSKYMNDEYKAQSPDTLADRLRRIDKMDDVKMLDHLSGYTLLLVQMTEDVIREVVGMEMTTVQWESHGGMKINFKVMAILCPQPRADFNGNTGIVEGSV